MGYNGELSSLGYVFFLLLVIPGLLIGYIVGKVSKFTIDSTQGIIIVNTIILVGALGLGFGVNLGGPARMSNFLVPFILGIPYGICLACKRKQKNKTSPVR